MNNQILNQIEHKLSLTAIVIEVLTLIDDDQQIEQQQRRNITAGLHDIARELCDDIENQITKIRNIAQVQS